MIDAVTIPIIVYLWLTLGKILNSRAYALSQGRSLDDLKTALITNPEVAQAFLSNTKWFTFTLFAGTLIVTFLTIFLFSFSRKLIWSHKKKYWKWNTLNLVLLLILLPYILINTITNLVLNFFIQSEITIGIINGLFLLIFLIFMFVTYHSFARTYKVGEAITYSVKRIKNKIKSYGKMFIIIFIVGIIFSLILAFLKKQFYWTYLGLPKWFSLSLEVGLFLLYIAWIRYKVSRI
jgi:hypothetical protein